MIGFFSKKLIREKKLGERLQELREEKRVKLSAMASILHIPERHLAELEAGRYENLPEEIYIKNFIRAYARAFGRDSGFFLDLYELETSNTKKTKPPERLAPSAGVLKTYLLPTVFITRLTMLGLLGLALLVYLGLEAKKITSPPELYILEPAEDAVARGGEIIVRGGAEPETRIQINGEDVISDTQGKFKETVRLERGVNLIKISASKRRSRERTIFRRVLYEEPVAVR
ncbi:helix-turn-helix domain-containing protein [Candidatus Uhrbacteria bacterium]|nr:helix-turn-helix domain-containing protein [Candidatus Uhrbacteria bacterium]